MIITIKSLAHSARLNKIWSKFMSTLNDLNRRFSDKVYTIILVNILIVLFQFIYLSLRLEFLNEAVPLWFSRTWGSTQLASKELLYIIPVLSLASLLVGMSLVIPVRRYYIRYGITLIGIITILVNSLLSVSLVKIIYVSSSPFEPLINPLFLQIFVTGIIAFGLAYAILPKFISFAEEKDLVTSPSIHAHPGMLLKAPSARGGGFIYGILFLLLAAAFIGFPNELIPFYSSLFLISILGILDDYQNTHPNSNARFMENPILRLILLFIIVSIVSTLGAKIFSVSSPLGGILFINSNYISAVVTTFWIVWVLNVLSWSNGIDGQYAGIVGIASILIALLALRFDPLTVEHKRVAILAAISAGLSFGFVKYTWHPSKILWGFGAMSAGLVLSVLSIMISSKIITSVLIILIPFLDASVTVIRRLLQGKNPLKGDRGHLHHILLGRGWTIRRIALFYWITTAIFGTLGYLTAEKLTVQIGLILVGLVAFFIVLVNAGFKKEIIVPVEQGSLDEESSSEGTNPDQPIF